jgi:nicotinate dehydrogenase subunit B
MTRRSGVDRRSFLQLVGGGIVVLARVGPSLLSAQERAHSYPTDFNAYLRIGEDGKVEILSGKIEMGQGVMTSQAQMAAEELGVSLDAITMILGDTGQCPWDMGTFGSLTTRMFGPVLRAAAAEARMALVELAAKKLGVPKELLVVENGVVSVAGSPQRRVTYGELARGRAIVREVDEKAVLKAAKDFKVMGKSPQRLDAVDKVTGSAKYAGDIRLPGLVYAKLLRPPAHGATLKSVDTSGAEKLPGATVVHRDDLVAVLHADPEAAAAALEQVKAEWNPAPPGVDQEGIFDELVRRAPEPQVKEERGTTAAEGLGQVIETTFDKGYVAHAPMEPHASVAVFHGDKLTMWASTQTPFPTQERIARLLTTSPDNVRVVTPYVGGGFGGKSAGQQSDEAARLAQITRRPVAVLWSREEEFFYDTFDPAAVVKIRSAVNGAGKITLWDYDVYYAGDRGSELFYDVPNVRMRVFGGWRGRGTNVHRFNVGPWRAPGANMNVYARECQIDAMAAAAGVDPVEFRLRNISDARMRRVIQAAADKFGWKPGVGSTGRGWGVACGIDAGTYATLMVQVKVDRAEGSVQVERVVCAQDMGVVVNPEGAVMQAEGCITMGLGYVLREEMHFEGGRLLDTNYDSYDLPRFSWVPRIEVVLVKNDEVPSQGGGEPAIVPMGGAVANAVFDATGVRMTRLPMIPARMKAALA